MSLQRGGLAPVLCLLGATAGACQSTLDLQGYSFGARDGGVEQVLPAMPQPPGDGGTPPVLGPCEAASDPACVTSCPGCQIEGVCRGPGDINAGNACQICDPARSATAWSNNSGPCNDNLYCTIEDTCQGGVCQGAPLGCDDGVSCNGVSTCDEAAARCSAFTNLCEDGQSCDPLSRACISVCPDCTIDGVCVGAGNEEPGNPCRVCDPAQSPSTYSPAVGKLCGSGPTACSEQDACDATGACALGDLPAGTACGSALDSACDRPDTCDGLGACQNRRAENATSCDDGVFCTLGDQCQGGSCVAGGPRCSTTQLCDEQRDRCDAVFEAIGALSINGMNADGSTLVGAVPNPPRAARWTLASGVDVLTAPANVGVSDAWATNAEGSVIVGRFPLSGDGFSNTRPFRWTQQSGMVALDGDRFGPDATVAESSDIYATGVSNDGNVIVGTGCVPFPTCTAFRWTAAGGFEDLGNNGNNFAVANGVSADGSVVIGDTGFGTTPVAFRWTARGGLVQLASELDWFKTVAAAISPDGGTTVGSRAILDEDGPLTFPERAVRWPSTSTALELPVPESWGYSIATDVSVNGEVIVGRGGADDSLESRNAWIWDFRSDEVRLLSDVLAEAGVDLTDWTLSSAEAVSNDGRIVAGTGTGPSGPSAWIARLR